MKIGFYLLILATTFGEALACSYCEHIQGDPSHPIEEWRDEVMAAFGNYGATEAQTLNANCKGQVPSDAQMNEWLRANQSTGTQNAQVHGINLVGESPENIEALRFLLTARNELAQDDPTTQRQFTSTCQKVECVTRELFGDTALETLYLQRRYGFNASHHAYPRSVKWKKSELRSAMVGILDFPASHFPLWKSRPFTRFLPGQLPSPNYVSASAAESNVRFFDRWAANREGSRQQTALHEIAHAIAAESGIDKSPEWRALSGWQVQANSPMFSEKPTDRESVVSGYGRFNALEDFAESAVAYRYNPRALLVRSPEKYEFIKHTVFDGVEYLTPLTCQDTTRTSDLMASAALQGLTQWNPSPEELRRLAKPCIGSMLETLGETQNAVMSAPQVSQCLNQIPRERGVEFMRAALSQKPWGQFMAPLLRGADYPIPTQAQQKIRGARELMRTEMQTKMSQALFASLSQFARVPTAQSCEAQNLQNAYRLFGNVYEDNSGRSSYTDRHRIHQAATRVCLHIARARTGSQVSRPVTQAEVQEQLKKLF